MVVDGLVGLWAAIVAGLVALVGYSLTQLANRQERKRKLYAEALAAVREYEELPFRIRRRQASDNATRAALGEQISDTFKLLRFHLAYLQIDSLEVGTAYADLVERTKRFGGPYRDTAWKEPVIRSDDEMKLGTVYVYDNRAELSLCLLAMRRELSLTGILFRRPTRRALAELRRARAAEAKGTPPTTTEEEL
jgi:hypothetical protein